MFLHFAVEWGSLATEVGDFMLPIVATILTVVGSALAKKYIEKMGLERSEKVDAMVDKYVDLAVDSAHRFAKKKLDGKELNSKDKLTLAISTVLRELEQSGVRDVGEEMIRHRIEAVLQKRETSEGKVSSQTSSS